MKTEHHGGDIIKELATLRNWHTKAAENRVSPKKKAKHMARAYLVQAAIVMIKRQDRIIADNAKPFTDPKRENYISR